MSDFKQFLKINKLKQEEAAEYFGVTQGFISQIATGKRPVPHEFISKARNCANITGIEYLSEDEYSYSDKSVIFAENQEQYKKAINEGLKMIPEVDFSFAAGPNIILNSENILRYWYLPDSEDCDAVVPMPGASMLPTYPPGCRLSLKKYGFSVDRINEIPFGNVFGIVIEDPFSGIYHGHIKRLRRYKDEKKAERYWIARSDNPDFDDFDIDIHQVRSLWIVKQHIITDVIL